MAGDGDKGGKGPFGSGGSSDQIDQFDPLYLHSNDTNGTSDEPYDDKREKEPIKVSEKSGISEGIDPSSPGDSPVDVNKDEVEHPDVTADDVNGGKEENATLDENDKISEGDDDYYQEFNDMFHETIITPVVTPERLVNMRTYKRHSSRKSVPPVKLSDYVLDGKVGIKVEGLKLLGELRFSSGTGAYTVSSMDDTTSTLVLTDIFMSICSSTQNSGSFKLDRASSFTLSSQDMFVLLGCSRTLPVFDPNEDLFGLDLPKLQCSSYASIYGFGGDETDPMRWDFGISLDYNDSYYTETCKDCEASGGFCGFAGFRQSFSCICRGGGNSTTNCYGRDYVWNGTWKHKIQTKIILGGTLLL
ncbi:wall-associated receptor kinase, galacturonan-binding domain-containing protein [Artemisia annua]|uniref:Wall-associated receptor kinase, galacturonan-binding domain-containing protein n=1 Tax=Artemisia annua TaxID=35608 RepID=A0A2U1MGK9_ARTAN|nr:wall-associated receptor kinase, galacturonan-binding domain-containing protein [Artemisia annua]